MTETPQAPAPPPYRDESYDHWYDIIRWDPQLEEWVPYEYEYTKRMILDELRMRRQKYPGMEFKLIRCDAVITSIEVGEVIE